jgi:hypothetical protein
MWSRNSSIARSEDCLKRSKASSQKSLIVLLGTASGSRARRINRLKNRSFCKWILCRLVNSDLITLKAITPKYQKKIHARTFLSNSTIVGFSQFEIRFLV